MRVAPNVFAQVGKDIMGRAQERPGMVSNRRWRSLFGTSPLVCSILWGHIDPPNNRALPPNAEFKHLMWGLIFLRDYNVEENHSLLTGVDEKTHRKWQWLFVDEIAMVEYKVILWENRRVDDILNDALTSVDGTDCKVPNYKPFWKGWYSHKFNHSGVR